MCVWFNSTPGLLETFARACPEGFAVHSDVAGRSTEHPRPPSHPNRKPIGSTPCTTNTATTSKNALLQQTPRRHLDEAIADVIGIPVEEVRAARSELAREPAVTNHQAGTAGILTRAETTGGIAASHRIEAAHVQFFGGFDVLTNKSPPCARRLRWGPHRDSRWRQQVTLTSPWFRHRDVRRGRSTEVCLAAFLPNEIENAFPSVNCLFLNSGAAANSPTHNS